MKDYYSADCSRCWCCSHKDFWIIKEEKKSMEILLQNLTLIMAVVGVLAFIVSVITQVFKGVGVLAKIPTDILVFVLSIALTVVAYVAYMDYIQQTIIWYMIIAAVLAGFLVAYVAMFGWEKFVELWQRFAKGKKERTR